MASPWPSVRQALIRQLRANVPLTAALKGDWSEGFAPQKTQYPLGVIALVYNPADYDWTGEVDIFGVDVSVFSKDQGEAASLDQLVYATLQDAPLVVSGQTSLRCRRVSGRSLVDLDEEGRAIYRVGGLWEIWTSQQRPTTRTLSVTLDLTVA